MARSRRKVQTIASLGKQVAALTRRVAALEHHRVQADALSERQRERDKDVEDERIRHDERRRRETAARDARWNAISAFDRQYWDSRIPGLDTARRERRQQLNEFLVARGLAPEPSLD